MDDNNGNHLAHALVSIRSLTHCCLMDQTKMVSHQWAADEEVELSLSVVFCVNWGFTIRLLIQGCLLQKKKKRSIFSCTAIMLSCYINTA